MIGDVVGDPGLEVLGRLLPDLIKEESADFVTVNGENAADGFGLTAPHLAKIFAAGADVVTGGNHIWEKREFLPILDSEEKVIRPLNYPAGSPEQKTPGRGWVKIEKTSDQGTYTWLTVNLQGRDFMTALDCPFRAFDHFEEGLWGNALGVAALLNSEGKLPEGLMEKPIILVDFHAESSREKEALAYYLDGRADVVAGTHTHVQTADERLLPKGTAYITDLGMTGVINGIIGMDPKICIDRARNQVLYRMEVAASGGDGKAEGKTAIQGIIVDFDSESKKAVSIRRINK